MHKGWYQTAFERELEAELTPVDVGDRRLVLVRTPGGVKAFDAICPHRGAHLAHGGKLQDEVIVCPFHGRRVGLGAESNRPYKVCGYPTASAGGLIFVLFEERQDRGFGAFLRDLEDTHFIVQGFKIDAQAPPELVVENGFDAWHFKSVHGLQSNPELSLAEGSNGAMVVEGKFTAPSKVDWLEGSPSTESTDFKFSANVFSPTVCVTRLRKGEEDFCVISAATPNGKRGCTIRVSLAVRPGVDGRPPSQESVRALLRDSRLAYEQDLVIWENLATHAPQRLCEEDDLVLEFHKFCATFEEEHG